jgi:hypothetical protein
MKKDEKAVKRYVTVTKKTKKVPAAVIAPTYDSRARVEAELLQL